MVKKLLYVFALVAMTSCSNDELVEVTPKQAITFGNAFVDNTTRAIDETLNTETLVTFNVYGTVTGTGSDEGTVNIFNGVEVKKNAGEGFVNSSDGWGYSSANTQYWIEGNNYKFSALVNGTVNASDANQMPTSISYDATQQEDLLYAESSVTNYPSGVENGTIKFTFDHLLSKAQFTFKNTITTNTAAVQGKGDGVMYSYYVEDVKITNAYKAGTYYIVDDSENNITAKTWMVTGGTDATYDVEFGNISNASELTHQSDAIPVGDIGKEASATSHKQMLLIPHNYTVEDKDDGLTITCTIKTCLNGTIINTEEYKKENVSVNLVAGHAYNFIISKGAPGDPIKFSVEKVNNWDPETGGTDTSINQVN